jgi:hypothetical protein
MLMTTIKKAGRPSMKRNATFTTVTALPPEVTITNACAGIARSVLASYVVAKIRYARHESAMSLFINILTLVAVISLPTFMAHALANNAISVVAIHALTDIY